ncbi:DUF3499 domain-containing protein [uncultured Nocardioides sp.]|uniref:DUF3499 domain-containing protein n=1 Tax=uncultured Nocardioides sp. TaxID=198441 RepID=UPI0026107207|nr:DUF3499 domain-containing protein [uncultured Nocardioides sp.]
MNTARRCSRAACGRAAVTTLTYVYADQTAVVGPLATYAEPHAYDLCAAHSERLSAPRGWEIMRLAPSTAPTGPSTDDLLALADAVRATPTPVGTAVTAGTDPRRGPDDDGRGTRRGHLRVLSSD